MPSIDMRGILEAQIAWLEETAGQYKRLSEMKQGIAEDTQYPRRNGVLFAENPEKFTREHKQHAVAALTTAAALKAVLDGGTKAEQIALMQRYVLEFGQSRSRNARLSNSLSDDDPHKEKVDQDLVSATFVVSILNSILDDIAPEPPGQMSSSKITVQPTMAGRLGQLLSWAANITALAILATVLAMAALDKVDAPAKTGFILAGVIIAAVIWTVGRGLRYVLVGS
jgi:hypothetical protein